jgi:hypothetical protein
MSVNQAGLERSFSDLKIKKARLRNRLKLPKLEKMAKVSGITTYSYFSYIQALQVSANIRLSQKTTGFIDERAKRQNHENEKVGELLAVPRYADLFEDDGGMSESEGELSKHLSRMVRSREGWRKEMAKWVQKEQTRSEESDGGDELGNIVYGRQRSKWLPRSLDLLFGGPEGNRC